MGKLKDLTSSKFGRLTPIEYVGNKRWKCVCDCGNITIVNSSNLRNGGTKSCGCLAKEIRLTNSLKPIDYKIDGDTAICYISSGIPFYIDAEDIDKITCRSWHVDTRGYISGRYNGKFISIHRYLLGVDDPKIFVDHIDRNKLNNRRSNLRLCNRTQNQRNYNQRADNTSGFSGVDMYQGKWRARIFYDNKLRNIGLYMTYKDAVVARYNEEQKIFGEFAPRTWQDVEDAIQKHNQEELNARGESSG